MNNSSIMLSRMRLGIKITLKYVLAPIGLLLPRKNDGLRVLFYHRVNSYSFSQLGMVSREITVQEAAFERQLAYLARCGYRSITSTEFERMLAGKQRIDPKTVLITFDDGYADNLEMAAPLLKKYGFTAIVFVVAEMIGGCNEVWPMSDPPELGRLMDETALRHWLAVGHEIGSHSCSHPNLTTLGNAELVRELQSSRHIIERLFGVTCRSLAYPGGDVNDRVTAAAEGSGYALGFTTRSGTNCTKTSKLALRRTEVSASDHHFIFCLKLKGVYDWLGFRETVFYKNTLRRINVFFARMSQVNHNETT